MHDADSHIMEPADWLHPYLDPKVRDQFPLVWTADDEDTTPIDAVEKASALHQDPAYRAEDASQITLRKNFFATGSFLNTDRAAALDHLGFASPLLFDTVPSPAVPRFYRGHHLEPTVTAAPAPHRPALRWSSVVPVMLA